MSRPPLTTSDGLVLAGRRWLSTTPPRAAVVLVHGFTSSADDPRLNAIAEDLHAQGFDLVSYDARGHGRSGGESTLGDAEQHDVAAAVATARLRADDVILVGASMGAIAALRYATTDPMLAGVVSLSSPSHWRLPRTPVALLTTAMTRTRLGRRAVARWLRVRVAPRWTNPAPPARIVGRIRVPVAFIHGTKDHFIPERDARELYDQAVEPRFLDLVPGMGHGFDETAVVPVRRAVEWALAHQPRLLTL
ncbi:MAG: hypothetical protein JJLCMIEE_00214 [Acidimicrobiales bacterium]|nr:MAG: alpha/beta fold hydrolase [Actinomycetota bacterium]MBV6507173.1 hypothetical protein [Acidimicrobiales bacterium]RIK05534.1 MAG: alpha/beta hydrolase [Acidobacteriota bacterium]